jgi:hypothetical protein
MELEVLARLAGRKLRVRAQLEDDWMAVAIVGPNERSQPCLHEVSLQAGSGELAEGVTASLWRRIKIGDIARAAAAAWLDEYGDLDEWMPELAVELGTWPARLGRSRVPDWYYAKLAQAFEERIHLGSREPLNDLARWLEVGRSTVDRRITEARKRGLFERASAAAHQQRLGGLTPLGVEVLSRGHITDGGD